MSELGEHFAGKIVVNLLDTLEMFNSSGRLFTATDGIHVDFELEGWEQYNADEVACLNDPFCATEELEQEASRTR